MSVGSYGADRDWLLRFAPREQHAALDALFAIEAAAAESLRPALAHEVAHAKLEWWREELERLAQGAPRHPATRTLKNAAERHARPPPDLRELILHLQVALAAAAFATQEELDEHLGHWASSIFRATLDPATLDASAPRARQFAAVAGPRICELALLEDFSVHARRGRIYLPLGDPPEAHAPWSARPLPAAHRARLEARRQGLLVELRAAAQALPAALRPALRVPLLWAAFAVDRAVRAPQCFGDHAPHPTTSLEPLHRTWFAWRAALAISRQRLPRTLGA